MSNVSNASSTLPINTVIQGDCLAVLPTFPSGCVDLVVTSPPYNVGLNYGPLVDDNRPWEEYYAWLEQVLRSIYRVLKSGGVLALNVPKEVKLSKDQIAIYGQRVQKIATVVDEMCLRLGYLPRESIVWVKGREGQPMAFTSKTGSDNNIYLRSASEIILLYSKERYYVDGGTGKRGVGDVPWKEETKDVWWIPAVSRNGGHPCPFPAEIPRRLIDLFTRPRPERGHIPLVLDPFAGSGVVGVVARQMGRNFVGIEINPEWAAQANAKVIATQPVFDAPVIAGVELSNDGMFPTPIVYLPLSAITVDPTLNVREGLDEATIEHYMGIFDRLPPVKVYRLPDGTHLLAAGFHRMEAARRRGESVIKAEVHDGTRVEAEECAILDNAAHGKPYTRAERRRAAIRLLRLHPDWANNRLADALGMSKNTVESVRQELERAGEIPRLDELEGADGKTYPRNIEQPVRANTQAPLAACEFDTLGAMNEDWGDGGASIFGDGAPPDVSASLPQMEQVDNARKDSVTIHCADVLEWASAYRGPRFHALLADPPYGLEFLGLDWDAPCLGSNGFRSRCGKSAERSTVFGRISMTSPKYGSGIEKMQAYQAWVTEWARALIENVLYPGAVCAFFGGTRTFHRLAAGLEDAGFEIFDTLTWLYGQGMTKGQSISKAMDARAFRAWLDTVDHGLSPDEERLVCSVAVQWGVSCGEGSSGQVAQGRILRQERELLNQVVEKHWTGPPGTLPPGVRVCVGETQLTVPATGEAQVWDGYGTTLKPAWEPIILCRAPRQGLSYAELAQRYGTGALNVDGCRIPVLDSGGVWGSSNATCKSAFNDSPCRGEYRSRRHPDGRWPANVTLTHTEQCRRATVTCETCNGSGSVGKGRKAKPCPDCNGSGERITVEMWECACACPECGAEWTSRERGACPECSSSNVAWVCPVKQLDDQAGELRSGDNNVAGNSVPGWSGGWRERCGECQIAYGDRGAASRFFYVAKAAPWEASAGAAGMYWEHTGDSPTGFRQVDKEAWDSLPCQRRAQGNVHPTKKPIRLVTWVAKLLCMPERPNGEPRRLLVPFCGSGAEVIGGILAGFDEVMGVEMYEDYAAIARARVSWWSRFGSYEEAKRAWEQEQRMDAG